MTIADVRAAALEAHAAGLVVGPPPVDDGSKSPVGKWAFRREAGTSVEEIERWYGDHTGLILIGARGYECVDFDRTNIYGEFVVAARAAGIGDLVHRIETGYCEATPKGVHLIINAGDASGKNEKLARSETLETLIEIRGSTGYWVSAPTFGKIHQSGEPYVRLNGAFATVAKITAEEREAFLSVCRSFDRAPRRVPPRNGWKRANPLGLNRPGDDFNATATWPEILEPHGWTAVYEADGVTYWRRPHKDVGVSASTNYRSSDLLYVWSTSTPFENERAYDKFGAFAILEHEGDFSAAHRALALKGFGELYRITSAADLIRRLT